MTWGNKGYNKECLSKEILKCTVKNEPTVNQETHVGSQDCIDAQELHWNSPEEYRKKMEFISPDHCQKLAGVLEVCAGTVQPLSG